MSSALQRVLTGNVLAGLILGTQALHGALAAVPLGRASNFAVLGGSAVVASTNETVIFGNVGVWPGTLLIFPNGAIGGSMHTGNVAAADAQTDLAIAYDDAAARSPTNLVMLSGDIGGLTLTSGVYRSAASIEIASGDLTLDARGNSNAVFIFQMPSTFTTAASRRVFLAGGARATRVFWQVGDSAFIGPNSIVKGNILANQSIDIQSGAVLDGRALARSGAVTLDAATVRIPSGGAGPSPTGPVEVDVLTPVAVNPQTGLLEQTIRLRNVAFTALAAVRVVIHDLPDDVKVYNRSGKKANGKPYVQYNIPLAIGGSVELVIEYLRASRRPFESTNFAANAGDPVAFSLRGGPPRETLRTLPLGPGRMLVEFAATPGRRFAILYSDDGLIWKTARPPLTAMANRVFWIDDGPPKTESKPPSNRQYEVIRVR